MDEYFVKFLENLDLTPTQKEDARIKYNGVCETVHNHFYDKKYDGSTKLLFGSYRKDTNIRPITSDQDVDVLIRLPLEIYEQYDSHESNGQSNLIQKIKEILQDSYTTTDKIKGWGKVILVAFKDGTHNVELLPAFEQENGGFIVPNSEAGGSWEIFDPRSEIDIFFESNKKTSGLTRKLSKIIKKWKREVIGVTIKSYKIEEYVIAFLDEYDYENKDYATIVYNFFLYLLNKVDNSNSTFVQTAIDRSKKALDFLEEEKIEKAVDEWQKIFGSGFPSSMKIYSEINKVLSAPKEVFIDQLVPVLVNPLFHITIDCDVHMNGFMPDKLSSFLRKGNRLPKRRKLVFTIVNTNIPQPFQIKWKVRNFGSEAEDAGDLRGEILSGSTIKEETSKYNGEHLIECYIIKNGICVARKKLEVPIS